MIERLIWICRISWWGPFYLFEAAKTLFWVNLLKKIKIVSLSWKLVPRLIRIWRIWWWCSFFFYFWLEVSFFGNFFQNSKLKICQIQWWFSFFFLDRKYPLWVNLFQKFKRVSLRRNLVPKLIWIYNILWWYSRFLF